MLIVNLHSLGDFNQWGHEDTYTHLTAKSLEELGLHSSYFNKVHHKSKVHQYLIDLGFEKADTEDLFYGDG